MKYHDLWSKKYEEGMSPLLALNSSNQPHNNTTIPTAPINETPVAPTIQAR